MVQTHYRIKQVIHGIAHITGGGIQENLDRILPKQVDAQIDPHAWPLPPVFQWLQRTGNVETGEMRRVFNMGIGLTLVVSPYYAASVLARLNDAGIASFEIGEIIPGTGQVILPP